MATLDAFRSAVPQDKGTTSPSQGIALLVMVAVLCFIVAYCCWGAPFCRSFCRRRCCCFGHQDLESSPSDIGLSVDQGMGATPTVILLPYGRMLVVDGTVFAQLQADSSGLDLIELGENVVRAQQRVARRSTLTLDSIAGSLPSVLEIDSETTSKDGCLSPSSGLPPTYNEIFGSAYIEDLPPRYDEILTNADVLPVRTNGTVSLEDNRRAGLNEPCHEYRLNDENQMSSQVNVPASDEYQLGEIRESRV